MKNEKRYMVQDWARQAWNTQNDPNDDSLWIVTESEIDRLENEWGAPREFLMLQVEAI